MKWTCLSKKPDTKFIQQKILGLIEQHIDQISKYKFFDEYVSDDLTKYLKAINDFQVHEKAQISSNLKDVEQLDEKQINELILEHSLKIKDIESSDR